MFDVAQEYRVTSVGVNPAKDRAYRMRMYFATMTLRVACIVSLFWVRGPWIILVAIGAIVLPYVAVLIANAVSHVGGETHETPSPLELVSGEPGKSQTQNDSSEPTEPGQGDAPAASALIVVDAPAERRTTHHEEASSDTAPIDDTDDPDGIGDSGDAA